MGGVDRDGGFAAVLVESAREEPAICIGSWSRSLEPLFGLPRTMAGLQLACLLMEDRWACTRRAQRLRQCNHHIERDQVCSKSASLILHLLYTASMQPYRMAKPSQDAQTHPEMSSCAKRPWIIELNASVEEELAVSKQRIR